MTKKRFMIGDDTECPVIEGKFELNIEEVTDLLNKQDEHLNILRDELELVYKKYTELEKENEYLKKKILEEIDLEVAYVNETYSDGRMSKEQHNGAIISLRQLREKFE